MTAIEPFLPASLIKLLRFFMPLYGLFIIWASLRTSTSQGSIPHLDKVLHAGVYALLALGVSLAWTRISKVKIWMGCLLYGAVMELCQGVLTANRTPSFWDFTANGVGAAAALFFIVFINQKFVQ